jgi:hypothetical protein
MLYLSFSIFKELLPVRHITLPPLVALTPKIDFMQENITAHLLRYSGLLYVSYWCCCIDREGTEFVSEIRPSPQLAGAPTRGSLAQHGSLAFDRPIAIDSIDTIDGLGQIHQKHTHVRYGCESVCSPFL